MTTENNTNNTASAELVPGVAASSAIADAETLIDRAVPRPQVIDLGPERRLALLPSDWNVQDLSKYLPPPDRIDQDVSLLTLQSFMDYVTSFRTADSVVFADEISAAYEAVLDYHSATDVETTKARGTCEHIARYACPKSEQWALWTSASGKAVDQVGFARFLEDNLPDISSPPAADFLQLVLQLQIHKAAEFVSEVRLDNGQHQLRYQETIRNDTKQGDLKFPDSFVIQIPVFVDGTRYPLKCRLRYRLDEGKLRLWYELERPADVFRAAVKAVSEGIRKGLEGVAFYAGKRG